MRADRTMLHIIVEGGLPVRDLVNLAPTKLTTARRIMVKGNVTVPISRLLESGLPISAAASDQERCFAMLRWWLHPLECKRVREEPLARTKPVLA